MKRSILCCTTLLAVAILLSAAAAVHAGVMFTNVFTDTNTAGTSAAGSSKLVNWYITNIDFNSTGPWGTNSDSALYVHGDRWYYQANDWVGGGPGDQGEYDDDGWVEFGWNITQAAGIWTYQYRLRTYAEANPIRNLLIQLSDDAIITNISNSPVDGGTATNSIGTFTALQDLPASLYGINFALPYGANHDFSIEFKTIKEPMWGNMFANDNSGDHAYAYNNTALSINIPRPDAIPEPATMAMLALGGMGLAMVRRRRAA